MPESIFKLGDRVRIIISPDMVGAVIGAPELHDNEYWYKIFFGPGNEREVPESSLEPATLTSDPIEMLRGRSWAGIEGLIRAYTYARVTGKLSDHLYTLLSAKTQYFPHQFKPILKFLDSFKRRILIADEVGLGKTIEAGYILREQSARMNLKRCLVVCPAALRTKWQLELERRFGLDWPLVSLGDIRGFLRKYREHGPDLDFLGIASMQGMRKEDLLDEWEVTGPDLDLVIVDEAHHMRNRGTLTNALGHLLSESAEGMLLLTATPIQLANENLFNLLNILDPEEFDNLSLFEERLRANEPLVRACYDLADDRAETFQKVDERLAEVIEGSAAGRFETNPIYLKIRQQLNDGIESRREFLELKRDVNDLNLLSHIFTRTKKNQVMDASERRPQAIPVEFTEREKLFYDAVTSYVISLNSGRPFTSFITMMPQRQVASCIQAAIEYWEEKHDNYQGDLESEEADFDSMDLYKTNRRTPGFNEIVFELEDLIKLGKSLKGIDTKYDCFLRALKTFQKESPGRKIIVFAFFKKTLSYLSKRLRKDDFKNLVISGDVNVKEREKRIQQFREEPEHLVLLSTEVGSEGLDLQFCSALVNYDLPWNPMVVEQRIGRLDRIGQKSPVINIVNLAVKGTIEEKILRRLYQRINIFERSLGDLEAILGPMMSELVQELLSSKLTDQQQEEKIAQKARFIEDRVEEFRLLEEESVRLVGHDEFFTEEIKRLIDEKRFVTPTEMKLYLSEFLNAKHPNSKLIKTSNKDIYEFRVDEGFESFVREKSEASGKTLLMEFLTKTHSGSATVTFDGRIAEDNPNLILMTHYHPVISAITKHYSQYKDELAPVSKVEVSGNGFSSGDYLYFLYEVEILAARNTINLEPVFIQIKDGHSITSDEAERLFARVVYHGKTYQSLPGINDHLLKKTIRRAGTIMARIVQKKKERDSDLNEAMILNRIDSISQSYNVKINKKKELLQKGEYRKRAESYLRMLRGYIRRLETEKEQKLSELEGRKRIDINHRPIACGFVRID